MYFCYIKYWYIFIKYIYKKYIKYNLKTFKNKKILLKLELI